MHIAEFSAPAVYQIEVQGELRPNWSDRFGDMQVSTRSTNQCGAVTVLEGHVSDQAELSGILNSLYELHLPLLAVRVLGEKKP